MSGRKDSAIRALSRVTHLHPAVQQEVLAELDREGLLDNNSGNGGPVHARSATNDAASLIADRKNFVLTQVQASADPRNRALLQNIQGSARHLGVADLFADQNKVLDVHELNKRLAGKRVEERMRLKESLYALRLIPA
jgi:hypothetical protein